MMRKDDRNTRSSGSTGRDGARGRMGTGTSSGTPGKKDRRSVKNSESMRGSGEEKGGDGYKSDDTADMSAIPPDANNQNESLESMSMDLNQNDIGENGNDSNGFLSDSDVDRATEKKKESTGKKGKRDSRSSSRSTKPNRRVSFGEGTKDLMEGDDEAGGETEEDDGLPFNESFADAFDDGNNGTDDNLESSVLGSRRSSVTATPTSRSRVGSSSGGKYSMGETPGSNEFTR
jgi:hypothetical protein